MGKLISKGELWQKEISKMTEHADAFAESCMHCNRTIKNGSTAKDIDIPNYNDSTIQFAESNPNDAMASTRAQRPMLVASDSCFDGDYCPACGQH